MGSMLIADSGSTKAEWRFIQEGKRIKKILTSGLSPYFLNQEQIAAEIRSKVAPALKGEMPDEVFFYGTGCSNPGNVLQVKKAIKSVFPKASIDVNHDLLLAARAICGREKGIACILGTGSNSCYYDGKKIVKNNPGLGFILGDEGSGAYLGKKVVQYYLYNTFDEELMGKFNAKYNTTAAEILNSVYKQPLPNRYLAAFSLFLSENRGHYMVENILEDGLGDFIYMHIYKYSQSWSLPINFTGSVAYVFRDVLENLFAGLELSLGKIVKEPMEGLLQFHGIKK